MIYYAKLLRGEWRLLCMYVHIVETSSSWQVQHQQTTWLETEAGQIQTESKAF